MTQEEREAGNVAVAVGMGWRWVLDINPGRTDFQPRFELHSPEAAGQMVRRGLVEYREPDGLHETYTMDVPDLFADSPDGAMARERAEEFLYRDGWTTWRAEEHEFDGKKFFRVAIHKMRLQSHGVGPTLAESRATAVIAAFQAISEGNRAE